MSAQTSNQVTIVPAAEELASLNSIAAAAAATPYWQKLGGKEGIFSIMLLAKELGVSPMIAVSGGFNNIQGKIEVSGRLMNQLIRQRGHTMKTKLCSGEICTIWGKRADTGEEMEVSYTIDEARISGLIRAGSPWTKTPSDMLFWRAVSRLAKRLFPDCIGSCYVEGEIREAVLKEPVETIDSVPVEDFKPDVINFPIPEGIDAKDVDLYFDVLKVQYKMSVDDLKQRAMKNPNEFWERFNSWVQEKK